MRKRKRTYLWRIILALVLVAALLTGGLLWHKRQDVLRSLERANLPRAVEHQALVSNSPQLPSNQPVVSPVRNVPTTARPATLPAEVNLAIPFTVQAPQANWNPPYGELCEEASVLMALSYLNNETIPNPTAADQKLLAIKAFEEKQFGFYEDTTVEQVATVVRDFYKYDHVQVLEKPSITDIKEAVATGKPVLLPAAGQELGNPFFQQPGPLYHMLVIKGYTTDGKFIVNDPGTRRGADFLYPFDTIMNAMHDWRTDRNIDLGRKVVLIVG